MTGDRSGRTDVSQDMLMAYVDGQLSSEDAARIARAIEADPALAADAAIYQTTRRAVAQGFAGALDPVVPDRLRALVIGAAAEPTPRVVPLRSARRPSAWLQQPWAQGVAAALLLGVGLAVGLAAGPRLGDQAPTFQSLIGPLPDGHPLAAALESSPSAQAVASGDVSIRPVLTFAAASGDICREFEFNSEAEGGVGVACRNAAGWTVKATFAAATRADPGGGFRVASGADPAGLEAVLGALDASDGFDAEVETCLLDRKWVDAGACLPQPSGRR